MRTLAKPTDEDGNEYLARDVFKLCISRVGLADLKARLQSVEDSVATAAAEFDDAASQRRLFEIARADNVDGVVTNKEMVHVYSRRMVPSSRPGRPVYNRIMCAPKHGRCPLCDVGVVTSLDHHLPKGKYSAITVAPTNLVPACNWCQDAKGEFFPTSEAKQTLHPYFDNFDTDTWLWAEVVETAPASFSFTARKPTGWSQTKIDRASQHLKVLKLPALYASNAATELVNIRYRLTTLFEQLGIDAVKDHLQGEAETRRQANLNSWQTAMYSAAVANDWFCNGGFATA